MLVYQTRYELSSYDDPTKHAKVLEKKLITNAQARQRMSLKTLWLNAQPHQLEQGILPVKV